MSDGNAFSGDDPASARERSGAVLLDFLDGRNLDRDAPMVLAPGLAPLTFADAAQRIAAVGTQLSELGVGREDRVALVLPNGPSMAVTLLGTMAVGIAAPLNPQYTADELRFFFTDLRPSVVIVDDAQATAARQVAESMGVPVLAQPADTHGVAGSPKIHPDDVALLLHTSGTTSRPKLVPLTHANLSASAFNVANALELGSTDRCFNVMPLFHIHGIVAALLATLASGGSIVCTPGFQPLQVKRWIEETRPTWCTAVPTIYRSLVDAVAADSWRPPFRFVRSSSAALPASLRADLERLLSVPVIEAYGMTEAAHQIASGSVAHSNPPGSVGPAAGPEISIVDETGVHLSAGQVGEIVIRGTNVTRGYVDNAEANALAFIDDWFRTGDQGTLDDDGSLTIVGRLKEIINRGGEKIAPTEVEDALLAHPDVVEAVVFALPHPRLGEDVGAAVVLSPDGCVSTGELRRFVAQPLAPFKIPRRVMFVTEIPKGATGKAQRVGMAERLGLGDGSVRGGTEPIVEPRDAVERELARMFADVLQLDGPVSVTDDFLELGADSLHIVELDSEVERIFQRTVPAVLFLNDATPERLAAFLRHDIDDVATIVPIQPGGSRPPLFCVMRAATLVTARHFPPQLGPDQPVFGIWMPAMHGNADAAGGIEEIAATCRQAIADAGANNSYSLFGYSFGGLVAYEMARQSADLGDGVGVVIMADTPYPTPIPTYRARVARLLSREGPRIVARRFRRALHQDRPPTEAEAQRAAAWRARAEQLGPSVDLHASIRRERQYVAVPRPSVGPVVLLRSRHTMEHHCGGLPALGWEQYVNDDWELHEVPGSHDTMIGEPHIHALAATVASSLQRTTSGIEGAVRSRT